MFCCSTSFRQSVLTLLFCGAAFVPAWSQGTPLQRTKVGDFVEFTASLPSLSIMFDKQKGQTLYVRYTVKAKTTSEATLLVQSWVGEREVSSREFQLPLNGQWSMASLIPAGQKNSPMLTLEKIVPQKFTLNGKAFECTCYVYRMSAPLFANLFPDTKEKRFGDEFRIGYLTSPEAPVLGVLAISMEIGPKVMLKLNQGTGLSELFPVTSKTPEPKK